MMVVVSVEEERCRPCVKGPKSVSTKSELSNHNVVTHFDDTTYN